MELTGLYLGGYKGGIAPALGVEGATVKEIGNTTVIDVPIQPMDEFSEDDAGFERAQGTPLKVSALGATPNWERWDHRLPTKDVTFSSIQPALEHDALSDEERYYSVEDGLERARRPRSLLKDTGRSRSTGHSSDILSRPGTSGTERTLVRKTSCYASPNTVGGRSSPAMSPHSSHG